MRLNVAILSACQACMFTTNSTLIVSAALIGVMLAPDPMMGTVPVAILFLFGMTFAMPASLLMKRVGRRNGFMIGLLSGITGAIVSSFAIISHSFWIFSAGIALFGVANAFGAFYRFAAADVSTESYRSRAISYVLAGSVVAAFIGPNMTNLTKDAFSDAVFAGSYMALAAVYLLSFTLVSFLKVPVTDAETKKTEGRPLREIIVQPVFILAVVSATVGYGVMNLLMTSTPLAMEVRGIEFSYTVQVIQWHIFAMFAPSFFTGHLVRRFGDLNIIFSGLVALVACVGIVYIIGDSFIGFCLSLVSLGVGWNFTFLGATTLLTKTYRPSEKAIVQGFNDLCVFSTVTLTALMSGVLHHLWGWYVLSSGALVPIVLVAILVVWVRRKGHYPLPEAEA
ncbi:MAG: MFS transporter [Acidiferrobacterales bacterium]|nr:MFS transporter [Acidiferrobacterales bacterium]